jgi:hypothetical protein
VALFVRVGWLLVLVGLFVGAAKRPDLLPMFAPLALALAGFLVFCALKFGCPECGTTVGWTYFKKRQFDESGFKPDNRFFGFHQSWPSKRCSDCGADLDRLYEHHDGY